MKLPDSGPVALARSLPVLLRAPAEIVLDHLQHGTFQRSMALLVAGTSIVSGMEVAYEHYKGSYSNPVMYTPVILSGALVAAGVGGVFSRKLATTLLRYTSYFCHARRWSHRIWLPYSRRRPQARRLAPACHQYCDGAAALRSLLFGTSAYLGVIASYLQREEDHGTRSQMVEAALAPRHPNFGDDISIGRFQKHLCIVCAVGTFAVGAESWYSHYKDNFKLRAQPSSSRR